MSGQKLAEMFIIGYNGQTFLNVEQRKKWPITAKFIDQGKENIDLFGAQFCQFCTKNTQHDDIILTEKNSTHWDFVSTAANLLGRCPLLRFCLKGIHKY